MIASPVVEALEERVCLASIAFAAPVTTNLNTSLFFLTVTSVGDLNGDGLPDLVVGRQDGSGQVFLGTSTGIFTPGVLAGPGAQLSTLGDFNKDGNLDLATAVGVLPGNGNGTFGSTSPAKTYVLPPNTAALFAADINGDGNEDLIAATFVPASSTNPTATVGVSVMLGNGDGSFKAPVSSVVGSATGILRNAATFAFDDINNDGKLDLVSEFGVMLGNGDGTFKAAVPFPLGAPATPGSPNPSPPPLPSGPVFAVGDFNGDGNLDVAVLPPATATAGNVEILFGKGDGTFSDHGPITVAAGATISALDAEDINGDGNIDLIAGVTSAANASSLAVMTGDGSGGFSAPALFTVSGPPITITSGDFNGDGNLDLLSINAGARTTQGTTGLIPATANVLLNSQAKPVNPVISLGASANRVVAGTQVKLSVAVQPPPPPIATPGTVPSNTPQPIPTGTVTFMNGRTTLGTATLKNGRATFTMTAAGVGIQQITAAYSGDATYAAVTSSPINQTVLLTNSATPLLVPSLTAATLPALFLPRDPGTVTLTLTNGGGAPAVGRVNINVYLSPSGIVDASAISISVPALQNRAISIGSGRTITISARFSAGSVPPGRYKIVVQIVPVSGITTDELTQQTLASTASFQAAGMVFGTVGAHKGLTLTVFDDAGNRATLSLAGPGMGTVTQTNGVTDVTLTGTNSTSQFSIATHGGTFDFDTITVNGSIGSINARTSSVTGALTVAGSIKSIVLASIGSAGGAAVAINLGPGGSPALSLGAVTNADLNSSSAIRSITAASWEGGQIIAPSISTLSIKGVFDPDVQTHSGGKLQSATIGTIDGGTWSISGGIGTLRIATDLSNASIYAGADAGPDNVLGTIDDRYTVASIASIFVGGSVSSTLIAAGAAPLPGGNIFAGLTLLPKAAIRSIVVRGSVSPDSRFLAAVLPRTVNLGGILVQPVSDPRFQLPLS